jgi:hypothetical protein
MNSPLSRGPLSPVNEEGLFKPIPAHMIKSYISRHKRSISNRPISRDWLDRDLPGRHHECDPEDWPDWTDNFVFGADDEKEVPDAQA